MRTDQFPKPFWRSERNSYYVQVGKRQVRLAADKDEAFRLYHELMARKPEERAAPTVPSGLPAVELIDLFLRRIAKSAGHRETSGLAVRFSTPGGSVTDGRYSHVAARRLRPDRRSP